MKANWIVPTTGGLTPRRSFPCFSQFRAQGGVQLSSHQDFTMYCLSPLTCLMAAILSHRYLSVEIVQWQLKDKVVFRRRQTCVRRQTSHCEALHRRLVNQSMLLRCPQSKDCGSVPALPSGALFRNSIFNGQCSMRLVSEYQDFR